MKIGQKVEVKRSYLKWERDHFYDLHFIPGTKKLGVGGDDSIRFLFNALASKKLPVGKVVKINAMGEIRVEFKDYAMWLDKRDVRKVK